jgi:hypothetical protein
MSCACSRGGTPPLQALSTGDYRADHRQYSNRPDLIRIDRTSSLRHIGEEMNRRRISFLAVADSDFPGLSFAYSTLNRSDTRSVPTVFNQYL